MRWSARLRGVPRNRGASRRPRAIRRLGRIKTPDAWVLRHVESNITARRMGGKRSPREPDLGDDRATQNVAEPGSPRGPAPGTAGTRGPTSRIPPQGGTSSSSTYTATGDAGEFGTRPPGGSGPQFRPGAKPQARSVAAEPLRQLDVEGVEVDIADVLKELGGPGLDQRLGQLVLSADRWGNDINGWSRRRRAVSGC